MKKILSASQISAADAFTIKNEPIKSIDLMERAAETFVEEFVGLFPNGGQVVVLVGPGNNGGDGLAIARLLANRSFDVRLAMLPNMHFSGDVKLNYERANLPVDYLTEAFSFRHEELLIDALFGNGLNRPLENDYKRVVDLVNSADHQVIAVDLPSGMQPDQIIPEASIINATFTFTFQRPKLSFLFPETGKCCGELIVLDIGLDEEFIQNQDSQYSLLEAEDVLLPNRNKFAHKGTFGHAQVFAGSKGKIGAAVLCSKGALSVGAGLVSTHIPARGEQIVQCSIPEAMVTLDEDHDMITTGFLLPKTTAACIGPGIGTDPKTVNWLSSFLQKAEVPLVIDADAINIIADQQHLLDFVAGRAILTPHLGELERLIGKTKHGLERIDKARDLACKYQLTIIIKGAYSAVIHPSGQVCFNTTGNPGMAKAGSGDVLTGVITGFLSQGFSLGEAALKGVYYHGLAGDLAKEGGSVYSFMASDLLYQLPKALSNV